MGKEVYNNSLQEVLANLNATKGGLTNKEVERRQEKYGENSITARGSSSFFDLLLKQFANYTTWLLIGITIFAFAVGYSLHRQEQIIDGFIVTIIIIINTFVGAYQDFKSEKTAELLTKMMPEQVVALRQGKRHSIDVKELVPGDVVFFEPGSRIAADCRIIECNDLQVDESTLTGESNPVTKHNKIVKNEVPLADRKNLVFKNTYVTRGTAKCVVYATGNDTEIGKIAESLSIETDFVFQKEVDSAGKAITYVALVLVAITTVLLLVRGFDWVSTLMIASAIIIGSIPEGLPAIVTFSLAMGSEKLAKEQVLVKRKSLLETLGSVDVVCTDKTGTLTKNKAEVKNIYYNGKELTPEKFKKFAGDSSDYIHFRNASLLANEAYNTHTGFVGMPEDTALIDLFNFVGTDIFEVRKKYPQKDMVPFSSETKCSVSYNIVDNKRVRYVKGAPETILERCDKIQINGKLRSLKEDEKKKILNTVSKYSQNSMRNIAFSYEDNPNEKKDEAVHEVFLGFVGMYDPPKEGTKETVLKLYDANVDVKMITGDNITTAKAIAKECGFRNIKAISWEELKDMSNDELSKVVMEYNVFARMSPEFKLRIVKALQERDHRIAITGDGVNDVPALKQADVGVAMGKNGSDIAREAGDIIILDDSLKSIAASVREGRTIFSNVRKVINYLLTANVSEVAVVFITALFNLIPFTAIQLLWVNFVTDVTPAMALGVDPTNPNTMKRKPTGKNESLLSKKLVWLTVLIGAQKTFFMLAVFFGTYLLTHKLVLAQTMTFTWLVFSHFVRIYTIRLNEKMPFFNNVFLNWSLIIPMILQLIILYSPLVNFFEAEPMNLLHWIYVLLSLGLSMVVTNIITKFLGRAYPSDDDSYG